MSRHIIFAIGRQRREAARMRRNEVGYSICRDAGGKLVAGPQNEGTPTSVSIPVACPAGATFEGLFHTHPGGVAIPSSTDVRSATRVGAKYLCIQVPESGEIQCYKPRRRL